MKKTLAVLLSTLLVTVAPMAHSSVKPQMEDPGASKPEKGEAKRVTKHKHVKRHKHVAKRKHVVPHPKKSHVEPRKHVESDVKPEPTKVEAMVASQPPAASPELAKNEQQFNQAVDSVPATGVVDESLARKLALRSAAVLVVDQNTGKALYAKNPDMQTPIASITKLMTSVVVLDANLPMSELITITDADVDHLKHSSSRLPVGATLTRGELLHLALIASENRAAAALARTYPGGTAACVRAMNAKAAALGMASTHYAEATGLDSDNRSTAADLAKLVNVASQYPIIHQITSTGEYGIEVSGYKVVRVRHNGKVRRVSREVERRIAYHNTNVLTRSPDWEIGLSKTGFINEAGHCLVMQAKIADRKVIMVLLDSVGKMSRIGDATRVRRWLEANADDS